MPTPPALCCLVCRTQIRADWQRHAAGVNHRTKLSLLRHRGQRQPRHITEGEPSYSTYVMGCSCSGCCRANAAYHQDYRLARKTRGAESVPERLPA